MKLVFIIFWFCRYSILNFRTEDAHVDASHAVVGSGPLSWWPVGTWVAGTDEDLDITRSFEEIAVKKGNNSQATVCGLAEVGGGIDAATVLASCAKVSKLTLDRSPVWVDGTLTVVPKDREVVNPFLRLLAPKNEPFVVYNPGVPEGGERELPMSGYLVDLLAALAPRLDVEFELVPFEGSVASALDAFVEEGGFDGLLAPVTITTKTVFVLNLPNIM